jgi:site-specific DNA-methyltransferase (adenine-specific)
MEATTDLWEIPAENATRVGHPAPFPVELPERLIELYTYRGDLVLDPFVGSGTTAVAALHTERSFAGYDTDDEYVILSQRRVEAERRRLADMRSPADGMDDVAERAVREGRSARELARVTLEGCGFEGIEEDVSFPEGIDVSFAARDRRGRRWLFDVAGGFTSNRPGLRRADVSWKALGKAAVLVSAHPDAGLVLLTVELPPPGGAGEPALRAVVGPDKPIRDVIVLTRAEDRRRLRDLARVGPVDAVGA